MLNNRPSLSVVTAIVFAVLLLVVALLLGGLTYYEHKRTAEQFTLSLFEEKRQAISNTLRRTFQTQAKLNEMNASAASSLLKQGEFGALHVLMHSQLARFSEISALYFSTPDDYFSGYLRENDRIEFMRSHPESNSLITIYQLDENAKPTEKVLEVPGFKASQRSWYVSAIDNQDSGWGEVFAYHAFDTLAIPHSLAVYSEQGELLGVLGNNVLLSSVGSILSNAMSPYSGHAVIFDQNNNIVASSDSELPFINEGGSVRMLVAQESNDPLTLTAFAEIQKSPGGVYQQFRLSDTGLHHFTHFSFSGIANVNWRIAITLPDQAVSRALLDNYYRTALVMLVAVVVAILLAAWLSRKISEPLSHLVEHFARVEQYNTEDLLDEIGFETKEVSDLRHSAHKFQVKLNETIGILNSQVEENRQQLGQIEKLALVTQSINDMCVILTDDCVIDWANYTFIDFLGLQKRTTLGKSFDIVKVYAPQHAQLLDAIRSAFETYRKDASSLPQSVSSVNDCVYELRFFPITQGTDKAHLLLIRDITAQRLFESELLIWKRLFMSSGIGIAITSRDGNVVERVNYAFAAMLGGEINDFKDKTLQDVLPLNSEKQETKGMQGTLVLETECQRLDGEHFPVLVTRSNVYDEEDEQVAKIIAVQDLTEFKQLQQQLLQSQKMQAIGTMAGGIVHDMSNVIASVMGNAELGLMYNENQADPINAKNLKLFNAILTASNRASKLTDQILSFSRMETSEFEPVSLVNLVEETVELISPTLPSDIQLTHVLSVSDQCLVMGNESQLQQVLINLLNNAIKAIQNTASHSGSVQIQLSIDDELKEVILSVADSGCGVPKKSMPFIFDPFFTTKPKGKGTGLGLSIVKRILDGHHASIDVESQEQKGTLFTIRFDRLADSKKESTLALATSDTEKACYRILVVDDDQELTSVWQELFNVVGFDVNVFQNPKNALMYVQDHVDSIDCIVTDYDMPVMTGAVFCQEVRKLSQSVPIVMVTGYGELMSESKMQSLGLSTVMYKPVTFSTLQDKVIEVIQLENLALSEQHKKRRSVGT